KRSIRQIGIYDPTFSDTSMTNLGSKATDLEENESAPVSILIQGKQNMSLEVLPTLTGSKYVSVLLGESMSGLAGKMRAREKSEGVDKDVLIGLVGTALGAVSKAAVHENIGWVQKFNLASGEFNTPGFYGKFENSDKESTAKNFSEIPTGIIEQLHEKRYIFPLKHTGDAGTYFNDSHTATKFTDSFAYIENNRTIDKAIRGVRASLLPQINRPLAVDKDGKLSADTIKFFENLANRTLDRMLNAGELSDFAVGIDPNQQVLSDSKLSMVLRLIPRGVARQIEVKIGFTTKLEA
ncbi:MAG: DUF2586 family protein, partial [Bacteroidales bacterium]|nr:DUF2586 family protein [Bacteroidales bacterium]